MSNGILKGSGYLGLGRHQHPRSITPVGGPPGNGAGVAVPEPERPSRPVWLQSILDLNAASRIWLTAPLASEVFLHLAMNLDPLYGPDMPQILVLSGAFGAGKTAGLEASLDRCGCGRIRIEAGEMESPHAGVPAQLVRARYLEASQKRAEENKPYALVMEDIHLAFGISSNTTNTINTQLTIAMLMSICDDPHKACGQLTERIPIFATANDLTKVYAGLLRPGRTRVVAIEASDADRKQIVMHIFRDVLSPEQAMWLFSARQAWPIAAFRQLKAGLMRQSFVHCHRGRTAQQILETLMQSSCRSAAGTTRLPISQQALEEAITAIDQEAAAKRDFTNNVMPS